MSAPSRHIGIMGGMFDPVHFGHLQAARAAQACCGLEEVLLLPCGNPVHRGAALSAAEQRCAMVELAIADTSWLRLDRRECDSPAPSRSFDTLTAMRADMPDDVLYFIVGMDAFLALPGWYRWREILDLVHLVVISRPGYELHGEGLAPVLAEACAQRWVEPEKGRVSEERGRIFLATMATSGLSSTQVRAVLQQRGETEGLMPATVADYIARHQLYQ